jgi:hypothetical protein
VGLGLLGIYGAVLLKKHSVLYLDIFYSSQQALYADLLPKLYTPQANANGCYFESYLSNTLNTFSVKIIF